MHISWKVKAVIFSASLITGSYYLNQVTDWAGQNISRIYSQTKSRFTTVQVVERYVQPKKKDIEDIIIQASARHKIPELLIAALIIQESGKGLRPDRMRYEPRLQSRFKREGWMTDAEYQALSTSWGYTQIIYGIWKDFCGLNSYSELLDPETNINCSAKILRNCLDKRAKITNSAERFKACLSEYNGDSTGTYSARVLDHLAELVILQKLG